MSNISVFNTLIILVIIVAGLLAVVIDDVLCNIIAMSVAATFMSLEFIILRAPEVAIIEIVVGTVLVPIIFIISLKKINIKIVSPKEKEEM